MIKKIALLSIGIMLLSSSVMAAKKTVAVMNFANYGGAGIKFLSNAVPESVSTALAEVKGINVVERRQLGKLIDEISLEQTGVIDTRGVSRAGRIVKADVLILGSVAGKSENVVVTMKAVEVTSGKVLDGKIIKAPIAKIFDMASQAARSMGAVISGQGIGKISVSTTPSGCDVFIDGLLIGKSPVVEYKVTVGEHRVKAVKDGYLDYDETVNIQKQGHERLNPMLAQSKVRNRAQIGFGASYFSPVTAPSDVKGAPYYYIFLGQSLDRVVLSAEIGYSFLKHDQEMIVFPQKEIVQERIYHYFIIHAHIKFIPFPNWKYISPYIGGIVGYTYLSDGRKSDDKDKTFLGIEQLYKKHMVGLGTVIGANIMPLSRISFFIDFRFYYYPQKVSRYTYGQEFLGASTVVDTKKYNFNTWTIGGGLKFYFNF